MHLFKHIPKFQNTWAFIGLSHYFREWIICSIYVDFQSSDPFLPFALRAEIQIMNTLFIRYTSLNYNTSYLSMNKIL